MMSLPRFAAMRTALLFVAFMSLAGCGERHEWDQKVTVTVETPSGEVSGSSVVHILARGGGKQSFAQSGPNTDYRVTGEATVVDLGSGRYLFALLSGAGPGFGGRAQSIAAIALCPPEMEKLTAACFAHVEGLEEGTSAQIQRGNFPLLVTFDDINDPRTVKLVDAANLAAVFGPGFALKSIAIEITDEKITEGEVKNLLEWLSQYPEPVLDTTSDPFKPNFGAKIQHGDFIRR